MTFSYAKKSLSLVSCCVLLCSIIIQPSTQQFRNKQILILIYYRFAVLTVVYAKKYIW
jgi:predicted MFS family arabinose efflux permease